MKAEDFSIRPSIRRVFGSKRMWVATLLLFLGLFLAVQAKRPLDLNALPKQIENIRLSFTLPIEKYPGPALLTINYPPNAGEISVSGGRDEFSWSITSRFSELDHGGKQFWIKENQLNRTVLTIEVASAADRLSGWLEFPKLGHLLHVSTPLIVFAAVTVILFPFVLSLLFTNLEVVRYGYFLAIFAVIMSVHALGLNLMLRAPVACLASTALLLAVIIARLTFLKRPII